MNRKEIGVLSERVLKNRVFLFFLSLVFAILLFFNVNQNLNFIVLDNTSEYVANDVKLDVDINNENQIIEGNPSTVSFKMTGSKADVERFRSENPTLLAKIDVKNKLGEKLVVPVTHQIQKNYNVIIVPQPKEVTINVYKKVTEEKPFKVIVQGPGTGYHLKEGPVVISDVTPLDKTVKISGPEAKVAKIQAIEFKVTVQDEVGKREERVSPTFIDGEGKVIDMSSEQYTVRYEVEKNPS